MARIISAVVILATTLAVGVPADAGNTPERTESPQQAVGHDGDVADALAARGTAPALLSAQVAETGRIRGIVKAVGGGPIGGVQVVIAHHTMLTDESGRYVFDQMEPGSYTLRFSSDGIEDEYYDNAPSSATSAPVVVTAGADAIANARVVALSSSTVTGTVRDSSGQPVAGARIDLWVEGTDQYTPGTTEPDGSFALSYVLPGPAQLSVFAEGYNNYDEDVVVPEAGTLENVTVELIEDSEIRGVLTDEAGTPVIGAAVEADGTNPGYSARAITNQRGRYTLEGLVADDYVIEFKNWSGDTAPEIYPEFYNDASSADTATPVAVAPETTVRGVNGVVTSFGRISGRVVDADGDGLYGARVSAGNYEWEGSNGGTTHTGWGGTFDLYVEDDVYRFWVSAPESRLGTYVFDDVALLHLATPVPMRRQGQFWVDVVFREPGDTGLADPCLGLTPTIVGTEGDDEIRGTNGPDVIFGLGGDDRIYARQGDDIVCAGPGDDRVFGGSGDNRLYGGSGVDKMRAGGGDDFLDGGDDRDFLNGGHGNDQIQGRAGPDRLRGSVGDDLVYGGADADVQWGGPGDDHLYGQGGNDILKGSAGVDHCDGGDGVDQAKPDCVSVVSVP